MDPKLFEDAARQIVDDDGAPGVALILADHNRLLSTLRVIYDEGAPARLEDGNERGVVELMRSRALAGLKLPPDLQTVLRSAQLPAATEGETTAAAPPATPDHEHDWTSPYRIVDAIPGRSPVIVQFCQRGGCGAARLGDEGAEPRVYVPQPEPGSLAVKQDEQIEKQSRELGEAADLIAELERQLAEKGKEVECEQRRREDVEDDVREFVGAMTSGGFGLPWWLIAGRAFDRLAGKTGNEGASKEPR
jgi:hypothetical protein